MEGHEKISSKYEYDECTESLFEAISASARLTNFSFLVIDFVRNEMVYRTARLAYIEDTSTSDRKRYSTDPYWAYMKEEDHKVMQKARKEYNDLVSSFSLEDKLNHTIIAEYSIYLKGHEYIIAQKFTPLKYTEDGKLWLGLLCVTPSTAKTTKHIAIYGKNFRYGYDYEKGLFLPYNESIQLTSMERELLTLAAKGMTTEEIAQVLFRSTNTIKSRRVKLFKKLHVSSITEAISFVSNYNLF